MSTNLSDLPCCETMAKLDSVRFRRIEFLYEQGAFNGNWGDFDQFSESWLMSYRDMCWEDSELAFNILYGMM